MSETKHNGTRELLVKAAMGGGAGIGALLAYAAIDLLKAQPTLLQNFGWPVSAFGMFAVGVLVLSRYAGAGVKEMRAMALANRDLAQSVHALVQKDDRRVQATEAAIGYVAQQNEEILRMLNERLPK